MNVHIRIIMTYACKCIYDVLWKYVPDFYRNKFCNFLHFYPRIVNECYFQTQKKCSQLNFADYISYIFLNVQK